MKAENLNAAAILAFKNSYAALVRNSLLKYFYVCHIILAVPRWRCGHRPATPTRKGGCDSIVLQRERSAKTRSGRKLA